MLYVHPPYKIEHTNNILETCIEMAAYAFDAVIHFTLLFRLVHSFSI
jgi:hypothetical protein